MIKDCVMSLMLRYVSSGLISTEPPAQVDIKWQRDYAIVQRHWKFDQSTGAGC